MMKIEGSWHRELQEEIALPYIASLKKFLAQEKERGAIVYPPEPLIFHALSATPFSQVKVLIMGQDPYHGEGQAHGLCFSVPCGIEPPPSLKNIFLELQKDVGIAQPKHGCLNGWAQQGVLLLNATLTVRAGEPRSHYGQGWEKFTDAIVARLLQREDPLVLVLWGKSAQEKCARVITQQKPQHLVLKSVHPSPLSAYNGFFGCKHFSQINRHLEKWGKTPIDWNLT